MTASSVRPAVVLVAALMLAVYFVIVGRTWMSSSTDPQRGMADGFLMMMTVILICLAGILWYGSTHQRPGMVWTVFAICALPSLSLIGRGIYLLIRWIRRAG